MMKTLFLHPPSFEGFDGGAGSRYQARREIRSFWYPTWLAQPAALVPGSKLVDAPPARVAVQPEESLRASTAVDFVARNEFDFTVKEVAQERAFDTIDGLSFRDKAGAIVHNKERAVLENMDALPFVTEVYKRDLKIENYFIGYLKHPYVSLYTGRGCKSRCTFCLWPQT